MTLRLHKNYGGILQNYALSKYLRDLGHDVKTVNIVWEIRPRGIHGLLVYAKRILMLMAGMKVDLFMEKHILEQDKITNIRINEFKQKYIPLTEVFYVPGTPFNMLNGRFDAFVVGSDQVWRPKYTRGIEKYFLDFVSDIKAKRLSYAASFGTSECEFSQAQNKKCGNLIKKFDCVSVREQSAIRLIKEKLNWGVNPLRHIDPTFLITREVYEKLISKKGQNGGLYYYILDESKDKMESLEIISKQLCLMPYSLLEGGLRNDGCQVLSRVEDWLSSIAYSDFVFTDSFHGCVFAIIFNKPFVVYGNEERGKARFESLLSIFGLESRYISSKKELTNVLLSEYINWDNVNNIIAEERERSKSFFIKYLS